MFGAMMTTVSAIALGVVISPPAAVCASAFLLIPHYRWSIRTLGLRIRRMLRRAAWKIHEKKPPTVMLKPEKFWGRLLRGLVRWLFGREFPNPIAVLSLNRRHGYEKMEVLAPWQSPKVFARGFDFGANNRLAFILHNYHRMGPIKRHDAMQYVRALTRYKAESGRMSDFHQSANPDVRLFAAPHELDIRTAIGKVIPLADIPLSDFARSIVTYRLSDAVLDVEDFRKCQPHFETLMKGHVVVEPTEGYPGAVTVRRIPKLPEKIPMRHRRIAQARQAHPGELFFGVDIKTAQPIFIPMGGFVHMLVAGTTGSGKSTFLHQIITQLLAFDHSEVARIILVDLKYGEEFARYRNIDPRIEMVWEFEDVAEAVRLTTALMAQRLKGEVKKAGRVIIVIDEFAQIKNSREYKALSEEILNNLNRISRLGRSAKIHIIAATQKPDDKAIPTDIKANLTCRVCFKVDDLHIAAGVFGDTGSLEFNPVELPAGRCIINDSSVGGTRYLQAAMVDGMPATKPNNNGAKKCAA